MGTRDFIFNNPLAIGLYLLLKVLPNKFGSLRNIFMQHIAFTDIDTYFCYLLASDLTIYGSRKRLCEKCRVHYRSYPAVFPNVRQLSPHLNGHTYLITFSINLLLQSFTFCDTKCQLRNFKCQNMLYGITERAKRQYSKVICIPKRRHFKTNPVINVREFISRRVCSFYALKAFNSGMQKLTKYDVNSSG